MPWLLNLVYGFLLLLLSPWLLYKACTTGKYRRGLREKLLGIKPKPAVGEESDSSRPFWFHGVSVGEIHLLRGVIAAFRTRHPDRSVVVSTTTNTGFDEACRCFPDCQVIFYPFDFSWSVRRTLRAVRPSMIVLAESELWPNFLLAARSLAIPVAVINGRMSPRTFARLRRLGLIARGLLQLVDRYAVQTDEYAENLVALGVPDDRVVVTGSVKYDGAATDRLNPRTESLRELFAICPEDLVWVAGSTQAPEEELILNVFRLARVDHPNLRLFLVPRQKDRFDEVARLLDRRELPYTRRSTLQSVARNSQSAIVLVDTIGELGALWGLADVAFVGGSLDGKRGGQNMIEPAAYGAAVVFGPHVWNFKDTATRLLAEGGACQVRDAVELEATIRRLLSDPAERQRLGAASREFVLCQQGTTERTLDLLDSIFPSGYTEKAA